VDKCFSRSFKEAKADIFRIRVVLLLICVLDFLTHHHHRARLCAAAGGFFVWSAANVPKLTSVTVAPGLANFRCAERRHFFFAANLFLSLSFAGALHFSLPVP
jgi:hypothetical protein